MAVMPDHGIRDQVLAELAWDPMVSAETIAVAARDGAVTLTGQVAGFWQKAAAVAATARVRGVRAVVDRIEVRLPPDTRPEDAVLLAAAESRLAWEGAVPEGVVTVTVEAGVVTLTGIVRHHFQRAAALAAVQGLRGVAGVADKLEVEAAAIRPGGPDRIRDDIRRAPNRGWFAADTVHVAAFGGRVTLSGSAATLRDRDLAVATAWSAPGTRTVENHIRIG